MDEGESQTGMFVWRVTFGNLLTIAVFLVTIAIGWGQLKTQMEFLTSTLQNHQLYDDKRFETLATKDTRAARDKDVDDKLADIKLRLQRVESFLMEEYSRKPRH